MQIIYGSLGTVVFFSCLLGAFMVGRRSRKPPAISYKPTDAEGEEARRKAEKMREGFQQLMSYDVTTAMKGKG